MTETITKFKIKWEVTDETLLNLAYFKLKSYKNGILCLETTNDPVERATNVLLYQDYWNEVLGMVAVQFHHVGLVMAGIDRD